MTTVSRRSFLAASGVGAAGAVTLMGTKLAFAAPGTPNTGDTLVVVFLRGGADGLSIAPPYGYDSYRKLRPNIAVAPPGQKDGALPLTSANKNAAFPTGLDGVVGLHPAFKPIHDTLWAQGKLAVIPATGLPPSFSSSRSHFTATKYIQAGSGSNRVGGGWLGRMVNTQGVGGQIPAVSTSSRSRLLRGSSSGVTVPNLNAFGVRGFRRRPLAEEALASMYGGTDSVSKEGQKLLRAVNRIEEVKAAAQPNYPDTKLGKTFSELSGLIKANIGVQAAGVDFGGWDHHKDHGSVSDPNGRFTPLASELAQALRAFSDDTNGLQEISVVVVTEFGRTINENGNKGTDHGRATTYLAMGAGIRGGVYGDDYPSEIKDDPDQGDLTVLTDFRKPLAEIVRKRAGVENINVVFPSYQGQGELGLSK